MATGNLAQLYAPEKPSFLDSFLAGLGNVRPTQSGEPAVDALSGFLSGLGQSYGMRQSRRTQERELFEDRMKMEGFLLDLEKKTGDIEAQKRKAGLDILTGQNKLLDIQAKKLELEQAKAPDKPGPRVATFEGPDGTLSLHTITSGPNTGKTMVIGPDGTQGVFSEAFTRDIIKGKQVEMERVRARSLHTASNQFALTTQWQPYAQAALGQNPDQLQSLEGVNNLLNEYSYQFDTPDFLKIMNQAVQALPGGQIMTEIARAAAPLRARDVEARSGKLHAAARAASGQALRLERREIGDITAGRMNDFTREFTEADMVADNMYGNRLVTDLTPSMIASAPTPEVRAILQSIRDDYDSEVAALQQVIQKPFDFDRLAWKPGDPHFIEDVDRKFGYDINPELITLEDATRSRGYNIFRKVVDKHGAVPPGDLERLMNQYAIDLGYVGFENDDDYSYTEALMATDPNYQEMLGEPVSPGGSSGGGASREAKGTVTYQRKDSMDYDTLSPEGQKKAVAGYQRITGSQETPSVEEVRAWLKGQPITPTGK